MPARELACRAPDHRERAALIAALATGQPPRPFAHAVTVGLGVNFDLPPRLATPLDNTLCA